MAYREKMMFEFEKLLNSPSGVLKAYLMINGVTAGSLARKCGLNESYLCLIKNGKKELSEYYASAISENTGIPVEMLVKK